MCSSRFPLRAKLTQRAAESNQSRAVQSQVDVLDKFTLEFIDDRFEEVAGSILHSLGMRGRGEEKTLPFHASHAAAQTC
jgi:hypothetical protein